jgi:hypothetical protein
MGASGSPVAGGATVFTGLDAQSGTEANVEQVMGVAQTFMKFLCFGPKPATGTDVFSVMVNGAAQAGTCTIPTGGTKVETASVSITIPTGDLFDVKVAQGSETGPVTWALAP